MGHYNDKVLNIAIIVLLLITFSIMLSYLSSETKCSVEAFLAKAMEAYYAFKNKPKPGISKALMLEGMSKDLILNSNVVNATTISINGTLYHYVVLRLHMEGECEITVNNAYLKPHVYIKLLPSNVTTTGGRLWTYEIDVNGSKRIVRFYEIPFIIGLYRLYGDSVYLGEGLVLVRIYVNYFNSKWGILWIILEKLKGI